MGDIATVTLTGLVVVFAVLILLTFIIWIYGKTINKAQSGSNNKKKAAGNETVNISKNVPNSSPTVIPSAVNTQQEDMDEIIAVIAAAVASLGASNGKTYSIRKIRRVGTGRSIWGMAGIMENTRPF